MPKREFPDGWHSGGTGNNTFEVVGYQLTNGARIEGIPEPQSMTRWGDTMGLLVHVHPKDDPEGGRHLWVMNTLGGDFDSWMKAIQRTAKKSGGLYIEFD